jgi:hypothetical protein
MNIFEEHCTACCCAGYKYIYMRGLFEFSEVVNVYCASQLECLAPRPHIRQNSGEAGPITAATGLSYSRANGPYGLDQPKVKSYDVDSIHIFIRMAQMARLWSWSEGRSCGLKLLCLWRSLETLERSISTSGCHADLPIMPRVCSLSPSRERRRLCPPGRRGYRRGT